MPKKLLLVLALLAIPAMALAACGESEDLTTPQPTRESPSPPPKSPTSTPEPVKESEAEMTAEAKGTPVAVINRDLAGSGEYRFDPEELKFKVGDIVEFSVTAQTEFHTFNVDELEIDVGLDAGETTTFTYTFDKAGEFRLYCIPHGALGMEGKIIVE